jgi:hypothetical protein
MINIPLLAVSKEVLTIGIVIGAIFLILFLLLIFKVWLVVYTGFGIRSKCCSLTINWNDFQTC